MSDQNYFLNLYFEMCDFSDECDICNNDKQEQSWAIMTCCNEVEQYLCTTCAMTLATRWKKEFDGAGCEYVY